MHHFSIWSVWISIAMFFLLLDYENNLFEIVFWWYKFDAFLGTMYLWCGDHIALHLVPILPLVEVDDHCEIMFMFLIEALHLIVDNINLLEKFQLHFMLSFISYLGDIFDTLCAFHDYSFFFSWRLFFVVRYLFFSLIPKQYVWRVWRQIPSANYYSILSFSTIYHENINVVITGHSKLILNNIKCLLLTHFWGSNCSLQIVSYIVHLVTSPWRYKNLNPCLQFIQDVWIC